MQELSDYETPNYQQSHTNFPAVTIAVYTVPKIIKVILIIKKNVTLRQSYYKTADNFNRIKQTA